MQDKKRRPSVQRELSPKTRQLAISLAINSILLLFVYYGAMGLNIPILSMIVTWGYMLVFGGFLVAYIAYNFAFTRRDMTLEMLPDSWSLEKKQEYINEGKRREQRSRWMLSVIIPFLVVFMAEALYLFVWTGWLENMFN